MPYKWHVFSVIAKHTCRRDLNTMNSLIRIILMAAGTYALYQNRYKIMNYLLGISSIRRFAVTFGMDLPFVRDRFMSAIFRA